MYITTGFSSLSTSVGSIFFLCLAILFFQSIHVTAQAPKDKDLLYEDQRIKQWSKDYLAGKRTQVLQSIEADLKSAAPHPSSAYIWSEIMSAQEKEAIAALKENEALNTAAGQTMDIVSLFKAAQYKTLLTKYPPASAPQISDPWNLYLLSLSAKNQTEFEAALEFSTALWRIRPNDFLAARSLHLIWEDDVEIAKKIENLAKTGEFSNTAVGRFILNIARIRPSPNIDRLTAVEAFLKERPGDARAIQYNAELLSGIDRFEEAQKRFEQSQTVFPFPLLYYQQAVQVLRQEQVQHRLNTNIARELLSKEAALTKLNPVERDAEIENRLSDAVDSVGEKGEARRIIEAAYEKFQDNSEILFNRGWLEVESSRPAEAANYLRRSVELEPNSMGRYLWLINAYQSSKNFREAVEAYKRADSLAVNKTSPFYYRAGNMFEVQNRFQDALAVYESAVKDFPRSTMVLGNLAYFLEKTGRDKEALERMQMAINVNGPSNWQLSRLRKLIENIEKNEEAAAKRFNTEISELTKKFPSSSSLWQQTADQFGKDEIEKKVAVWREAAAANPGADWPWVNAINLYADSGNWDEAETLAATALKECVKNKGRYCESEVSYYTAWITISRSERTGLPEEKMNAARDLLNDYMKLGGSMHPYYRSLRILSARTTGSNELAGALLSEISYGPNSESSHRTLLFTHLGAVGHSKGTRLAYKYVQRNPYDINRWRSWSSFHVKYGGSPIVTLQTGNLIRERFPSADRAYTFDELMAFDQLGDSNRRYDDWYEGSRKISTSDRYIGWFENSRKDAQREAIEGGTNVQPDEKDPDTFQVIYPNGRILKMKDHPITGQPILRQVGAAKLEVKYDDETGNMLKVQDTGGNFVELSYDENERIKTMLNNEGVNISFEYNKNGKPIKIVMDKVGFISVAYDPKGEISKVESPDGHVMALQVTQAFQNLLALVNSLKSFRGTQIPDLPLKDEELDRLRSAYREKRDAYERSDSQDDKLLMIKSSVDLAAYLTEHRQDRGSYEEVAKSLLEEVFNEAKSGTGGDPIVKAGLEAVRSWHTLILDVRPKGVGKEDWENWTRMREWVFSTYPESAESRSIHQHLIREFQSRPLKTLESAKWLEKTYLHNEGFWRRFRLSEVMPEGLDQTRDAQTVLVRANGEVVVGTRRGISVLRRGFWEKFVFDGVKSGFSNNSAAQTATDLSNILSLAEDGEGRLWIGTTGGLIYLDGGYQEKAKILNSVSEGLPSGQITQLAGFDDGVLIGTASGIRFAKNGEISPEFDLGPVQNSEIKVLKNAADSYGSVLIGTSDSLYFLAGSDVTKIASESVKDALFSESEGRFYYLRNDQVFVVEWNGAEVSGEPQKLMDQRDIVGSQIYGLDHFSLGDDKAGVAFLTERGISILYGARFEHKTLPYAQRDVGVRRLSTANERTYMITDEGIYALEKGQQKGDALGRVYDLLTDNEQGLTFVARGGNGLWFVSHSDVDEGARVISRTFTTHLAKDQEGGILFNDGNRRILRYPKGSTDAEVLFEMSQTVDGEYAARNVTAILSASDGTVWVTAGGSLFRWKEGELEEFSIFKDAVAFPSGTEMLHTVIETIDKRIWVIGSDEGHLLYKGRALSGGVLEYDGKGFKEIGLKGQTNPNEWFIHGYTKIDDTTSIVATAAGFVRHQGERFSSYSDLKDLSYKSVEEKQPMLWLGTDGAKLGKDVWLFGTAGGIVAFRAGAWFYPDRINGMLPEDFKFGGKYGVRTVHAVETDNFGRVYAGTDRGLLIYDSGGGDESAFLLSNHFEKEYAFKIANQQKLQEESAAFLSQVPPESETGKLIKRLREYEREIEDLEKKTALGVRLVAVGDTVRNRPPQEGNKDSGGVPSDVVNGVFRAKVQEQLEGLYSEKKKLHQELLDKIRESDPGLFQMLKLDPPDLLALRQKLSSDQVAVQFLPTNKKLFIQIVTSSGEQLREVAVSRADLKKRTLQAANALSAFSGVARTKVTPIGGIAPPDPKQLKADLVWLYDQLLRPVQSELAGKKQVFIVPVGELTYLPFAALIQESEPKVKYAVETHNFGYMPTMYHFALFMDKRSNPRTSQKVAVFGDPDGSLPGALAEAKVIKTVLNLSTEPVLGKNATHKALIENSNGAGIVHLATHGGLSEPNAGKSWILLADKKINMYDVSMLPLQDSEMIVLSACETGLGSEGLEYSTLARSFARAGAPTVVATLWKVNDRASKELMENFYTHIGEKKDRFVSLADAQRAMIATGDELLASPSAWAAYIPFGSP